MVDNNKLRKVLASLFLLLFISSHIGKMYGSEDSDLNTSSRSVSGAVESEKDFDVVGDLVEPYRFEPVASVG